MQKILHSLTITLIFSAMLVAKSAKSQEVQYFDDYESFTNEYEEWDEETRRVFGRFFQTAVYGGAGLFSGELGQANTSGINLGIKFIYYFDKMWGAEIGGFLNFHNTLYDLSNTGVSGTYLEMKTRLIPVVGSLRFTFDSENLPRGLSQMNPYVSVGGALVFRQETVVEATIPDQGISAEAQSRYSNGAIYGSTNFGFHVGTGAEFDIYKNKVFAGVDLRYYSMFWSDANLLIGNLGRLGSYFTFLGSISYSY